jgi:hypothetical protein
MSKVLQGKVSSSKPKAVKPGPRFRQGSWRMSVVMKAVGSIIDVGGTNAPKARLGTLNSDAKTLRRDAVRIARDGQVSFKSAHLPSLRSYK